MKFLLKIQLILLISTIPLISQNIFPEWISRYNGPANAYDGGVAIKTDASGNIYITGTSYGINTGRDYLTIKYNQNGDTSWVRRFNGDVNGGDYSWALAVDNSGNVYVTGRCDRGGPTFSDYATIKYNSLGTQQWVAYYNGPGNGLDEAKSIIVDNSGNVYVTGKSLGVNTDYDIATVKYNSNGTQLWAMRYDGPSHSEDVGSSIALDQNGNIYVTGGCIAGSYDAVLIKYSNDGTQQWVQRYNGLGNGGDFANVVKIDANNNIYIGGYTCTGGINYDYLTIKYNSAGVQQWLQRYDGCGLGDFGTDLALDNNGNVYITGSSITSSSASDSIFATVKYNSNGVQQWAALYPGPLNSINVARSITTDNLGNVYITGSSFSSTGADSYVTIEYNSNGIMQWIKTYNGTGTGTDVSLAIAVDGNQNVYVTGKSMGMGSDYDAVTIKYSKLTGIINSGSNIPLSYNLLQNYPNPFNPETTIPFDLPKSGFVKLTLYDILGKEIAILVNQALQASSYKINVDASSLNSGVYFYKLQANDFVSTKKMIVLK